MMSSTVYVAATFALKGGLLHLSELLTSSAQLCWTCSSMTQRTSPLAPEALPSQTFSDQLETSMELAEKKTNDSLELES